MPLAANPFLQPTAIAAPKGAVVNAGSFDVKPVKTGGEPFSKVYAQASDSASSHGAIKPDAAREAPIDSHTNTSAKIADSGKSLPAGKPDDAAEDAAPVQTDDGTALTLQTVPVIVDTPSPTAPAQPDLEAAQLAVATSAIQVPPAPLVEVDDSVDPQADPLDDMPTLRLAMEQGGHVSASSRSTNKNTQPDAPATSAQGQANTLALLVDPNADASSGADGGDKAFKGLIDEGLKDLKSASSDTRVDDFANRLAALIQATVPKTANALPVNQPLAMHQSGWSEEIVNRVMYLSSANLKSADIQLQPAELGRLDIRVNLAADQSAQVNFVSAHAGVREALDSQMHRLREMLAQQGMGQVDVSVSDQSRSWQGQGQEQQRQPRSHASGERLEDESPLAAPAPVAPSIVLGTSAVDYYA
ncbi:flagellar hook-length control protein FliK [Pseudomonas sp. SIMBA_077]